MLVTSLMMMGVATFAIGLLPTYATIGIAAPILLLVCRLVQGFAVGGEWGGAVLMVAEHGDEKSRGFWSSWPQAGVPLGNMLATGVLFVLAAVQSDADFEAWGWRIPFLLSAVLVIIGLFVRLSLEESPVFQEAKAEIAEKKHAESHLPILEVIKTYPQRGLHRDGHADGGEHLLLHLHDHLDHLRRRPTSALDNDLILKMLLIGAGMQFVIIPLIGALSDRVGRRPLYLVGAVGVGVWRLRVLRPARRPDHRERAARRRGRPVLPLADVRPAGGVLLRAVRHLGALHRRVGRLPAGLDLRRRAGPDHRRGAARATRRRTPPRSASTSPIASVLTIIAVLFAKETKATSLRHDRVVRGAHRLTTSRQSRRSCPRHAVPEGGNVTGYPPVPEQAHHVVVRRPVGCREQPGRATVGSSGSPGR